MNPIQVRQPEPLGLTASFGFGDRTGLATPGHLAAMRRAGAGIAPIFAQQSIREMQRTARTPQQVMADAIRAIAEAAWTDPHGADADHLKTCEDVDRTVAAGFTFFTIDPSEYVDPLADDYDPATVAARFAEVADIAQWVEEYSGRSISLAGNQTVELTPLVCQRAAVKYGRALEHALELAAYIDQCHRKLQRDYEIELSVDETPRPTTLAEHYMIAEQCLKAGMRLVSLAPRLPGDFEKGIDYRGDLTALRDTLHAHAAIARMLGPYKLSLHSGSDKLSIYAMLAEATRGQFHVKTAGTSYLEALRVAARHDAALLREIIDFSRQRFNVDKATYHISATLAEVPPPGEITSAIQLEQVYLGRWTDVPEGRGFTEPGRQILHCTFGSILTHPQLGTRLLDLLRAHHGTYTEVLEEHFSRHLDALRSGMQ